MITHAERDAVWRAHHKRLLAAAAVGAGDRVIDVGCGAGRSMRDAAPRRDAPAMLGSDICAPALERARQLTLPGQLGNVTYERSATARGCRDDQRA